MENSGWYLMAYDIADPRRLARIYRLIKRHCLCFQKSVFLVRGTEKQVDRLMDRVEKLMKIDEDDLRAYPVRHPSTIRFFGDHPMQCFPLVQPGAATSVKKRPGPGKAFWQRLMTLSEKEKQV